MVKKKKEHYVDNAAFYAALVEYHKERLEAEAAGLPRPRASRYIGECFMLIAENVAVLKQFRGYTYRDEMIADAVENCIRVIHSFNPEKSKYPFAYFTMVAINAFKHRLNKEHKQVYINKKLMDRAIIHSELVDHSDSREPSGAGKNALEYAESDYINDFVTQYEAWLQKRKKPKKPKEEKEESVK